MAQEGTEASYDLQVMDEAERREYQEMGFTDEQIKARDEAKAKKIDKRVGGYVLKKTDAEFLWNIMLTIVLIGKTGSGMSSTGDLLVGEKQRFASGYAPSSITSRIDEYETEVEGQQIRVLDTPGLAHTELSEDQLRQILASLAQECPNGVHAFLYVHNLTSRGFSDEDKQCLALLQEILGGNFLNHTVMILTHAESVLNKLSLSEYHEQHKGDDNALFDIMERQVDRRVVAVDNQASSHYERRKMQQAILQNVQAMVKTRYPYLIPTKPKQNIVIRIVLTCWVHCSSGAGGGAIFSMSRWGRPKHND